MRFSCLGRQTLYEAGNVLLSVLTDMSHSKLEALLVWCHRPFGAGGHFPRGACTKPSQEPQL